MKNLLGLAAALGIALGTAPAQTVTVEVVFSTDEIATIHAYYGEQTGRQNSRGRGGRGLPPGIAKNLERGKRLPPGIAKQSLPQELATRLPPPLDGHERIIVAGKILLVEIATRAIHDVLSDILLD